MVCHVCNRMLSVLKKNWICRILGHSFKYLKPWFICARCGLHIHNPYPPQGTGAAAAHAGTHIQGGADPIIAALDARAIALTTQGDIVYHPAAANTLARLGAGVAGQSLITGGPAANPAWGAPAPAAHVLATTGPHTNTLPLTDLAVGVQGNIIHRGVVDWEALAVGGAGQALLSAGAGANVLWGAPAPAAHAAAHLDGAADEIDAADLAGAGGAAGEIIESDGAALSYVEPDGRYTPAVHGAAQHTDVTRELFIPALSGDAVNGTPTNNAGYAVVSGTANAWEPLVMLTFKVPDDFVSFVSLKAVWWCSAAAGNMYWYLKTYYAASGQERQTHTEASGYGTTATGGANLINVQESSTPLVMANLEEGDYVGIEFSREGTHGDDTLDAVVYFVGILFTYTAEQ